MERTLEADRVEELSFITWSWIWLPFLALLYLWTLSSKCLKEGNWVLGCLCLILAIKEMETSVLQFGTWLKGSEPQFSRSDSLSKVCKFGLSNSYPKLTLFTSDWHRRHTGWSLYSTEFPRREWAVFSCFKVFTQKEYEDFFLVY